MTPALIEGLKPDRDLAMTPAQSSIFVEARGGHSVDHLI
jgi:hypothetical protein